MVKIVIVGCSPLGIMLGGLFARGKDNEVQYIDRDFNKEPKPKLKIDNGWCKFGGGEIYFFTDQQHEYHFVPLLDKEQLKYRIEEIKDG